MYKNKSIKSVFLISFLLITQLCISQFINKRIGFGTGSVEVGWDAVENNSGYLMVGGTVPGNSEIGITQTDFSGNIIFQKTYGQPGVSYYCGYQNSLTKLINGGYAMYGGVSSGVGVESVGVLFRFNDTGDVVWTKNYGDSLYFQTGRHMRQTLDGGFILLGDNSTPSEPLWVIKTDSLGVIEWEHTYGGPNYEGAAHIAVCDDGGYIFSGNTESLGLELQLKTEQKS